MPPNDIPVPKGLESVPYGTRPPAASHEIRGSIDPDPPAPITIPDGEPEVVALAMLVQVCPDAADQVRTRIDTITAELEAQVETARLETARPMGKFISEAHRNVLLRQKLQARLGTPSALTPAAEICGLVRSVARWANGDEIKAARAQLVARLNGELAPLENDLRNQCEIMSTGGKFSRTSLPSGGVESDQPTIFLSKVERLLTHRRALRLRLSALDDRGDSGRSAATELALEAAGGVATIVSAIAPTMVVDATKAKDRAETAVKELTRKASDVDQATAKYRAIVLEREAAVSQAFTAGEVETEHRAEKARGLIEAATTGNLAALHRLETATISTSPKLAASLSAIRGSDREVTAMIEEMVNPPQPPKGQ
jgi:hypothetical protein